MKNVFCLAAVGYNQDNSGAAAANVRMSCFLDRLHVSVM